MKIRNISLVNFRQHRNVNISLDQSDNSFTVIKGRNGSGKTNLLKAITWSLTGRLSKDEVKFDPKKLISLSAAKDANKGDSLEVKVKLDLDLGQGEFAQVERSMRFVKTGNGIHDFSLSGTDVNVLVLVDKLKGYQKEPNPEIWIERMFPERFSHYFLFDGEHLHRFFRETETQYVKKAILEIANIDHLQRIVDRLNTVNQSLIKETGNASGLRGQELSQKYDDCLKAIEDYKLDFERAKEQQQILQNQIEETNQKMGDIKSRQADINLRNRLEEQAEQASKNYLQAKVDLGKWAFGLGPAYLMGQALDHLREEISKAKSQNVLPPPFKVETLNDLIQNQKCICGNSIAEDSRECKEIEKLILKFSDLSEIGSVLSDLQEPLHKLNGTLMHSSDLVQSAKDRMANEKSIETEAVKNLNIVREKLVGSDDAQIALISNQYYKATELSEHNLRHIGSLETLIENETHKVNKIKAEMEIAAKSEEKSKQALEKRKFAEHVLSAATSLYEKFSNEVKEMVAQKLDEEFQAMVWKKNYFKPVQIDDDYRILVYNSLSVESRSDLSAGETACLAFAFSLTLSKVAGFSYPMVVDSPLGRLDSEVKEFVSGVLARTLDTSSEIGDKQILLLMTDSEYTTDVADALAHMKPKVLEILFDQEVAETSVIEAI